MKLVKNNKKVVPLYQKSATVQNILKDTTARNELKKIVIIGMDKDDNIVMTYSKGGRSQYIGMLNVAINMIYDDMQRS